MQINATSVRAQSYVPKEDLGDTAAVEQQLGAIDAQERGMHEARRARGEQIGTVGKLAIGAATIAGGAIGAILGGVGLRSSAAASAATGLGAVAGAALAGGVAYGVRTLVHAEKFTADENRQRNTRADQRTELVQTLSRAEARNEVGVNGYNSAIDTLLTRFDHDGNGAINIAPGQDVTSDERITVRGGAGPVASETDQATAHSNLMRAADADGDARVTGEELASALLDSTAKRHSAVEWSVTPDGIARLADSADTNGKLEHHEAELFQLGFAHELRGAFDAR